MRVMLSLAVAAGCAGSGVAPTVEDITAPAAPLPDRAAWALSWHGAAIGGAWERDDGARFERRERIVVRRGDEVVVSDLAITIDRDAHGAPAIITVSRWQDGPVLTGVARATGDGGWRVEVEGEPAVVLPPAVPFELAIRDAARHGGFDGAVVLAGWGFAVADLSLHPDAAAGFTATLTVGARRLTAAVRYDDDGAVAELRGGDGVIARRAATDADLRPAAPAEVVDSNAITVDELAAAAPPIIAAADVPAAAAGPDRTADIHALVHQVAADIEDDLGATAATTAAARAATRGDCTTHALRFAALAADAGIRTRVVTGLRRDGDTLIRHRWNLAWTGSHWLAVDATWDEAPAGPALIGLAVHGARAADLAAADATVFDGLGQRQASASEPAF